MGKVGIVTLPGKYNYGNRLQAYANWKIYSNLGYEASLLVPGHKGSLVSGAERLARKVLGREREDPESLMSVGRREAFSRFEGRVVTEVFDQGDTRSVRGYDLFSVGSDQVWNPYFNRGARAWYYLEFASPDQRIALSPSIGLDEMTPIQGRSLARGVKGFDRVSVRENRGADLIERWAGKEAVVLCDPTLVLGVDEWRAVASDLLTPDGPYVFTYLLGGLGGSAEEVLHAVTGGGAMPVISLSDREGTGQLPAGPAEFISLIDHAYHVVTDSFHAAVFSSILETPLTIVRREGGVGMFSRLETLADLLDLRDKIYGANGFSLDDAGSYGGTPGRIARERDRFFSYLDGCIHG